MNILFQIDSICGFNWIATNTRCIERKKRCVTCELCGMSFYVEAHLILHMRSHTDKSERLAQRQQYEHCGEWLMSKSGIYYHQQECDQCDMELPNRIALKTHIRNYHREHKFNCNFCDKTFYACCKMRVMVFVSFNLKRICSCSLLKFQIHEDGHTRQNTYPCKFCTRTFSVFSSRQTHTRRNHSDELKRLKEMKNDS